VSTTRTPGVPWGQAPEATWSRVEVASAEQGGRAVPFKRISIEPDDVEGHVFKAEFEDLSGREVTVRLEDGTEVQGHVYRLGKEDMTGDDVEDHVTPPRASRSVRGAWVSGLGLKPTGCRQPLSDVVGTRQTATGRTGTSGLR
jgi:hypothetical protein